MTGFPTRPTRQDFGPQLKNARPIENPELQVGEETLNPALWQLAGAGLMVPRAVLIAEWTGSAMQILYQQEAWNPRNDQPKPGLSRSSAGVYIYSFAATYLDEKGEERPTNILAADVKVQQQVTGITGKLEEFVWTVGNVVHFRFRNHGGTDADAKFWLRVF